MCINMHIQEAQQTPSRKTQRDPHLDTLNYQKPKRESWKRKMTSCTKNPLIRNRRGQKAVGGHTWWRDILLWMTYCFLSNWNGPRKKIYKPRILHPAKLIFKNKGEIKTFPDKQHLKRESVTSRSALQEILESSPGWNERTQQNNLNPQKDHW